MGELNKKNVWLINGTADHGTAELAESAELTIISLN
jgi:hypothetical protein